MPTPKRPATHKPTAGPAAVGAAPVAPNTRDDPDQGRGLPLPHERDESPGNTATQPDPVIVQAKRDLDRGLVDTDLRATPGLDAARRKGLVPQPEAPETAAPATRVRPRVRPTPGSGT